MDKHIFLLNDQTKYTGISNVTMDIYNSIENATIISLIMNNKKSKNNFYGKSYYGLNLLNIQLWPVNAYFQKYIYKNVYNEILLNNNFIIHYLNMSIYPALSENSIVTIHDLFAVNKRYNKNRIYSSIIKRNLKMYKKFNFIHTVSNTVKKSCENYGFDGKIYTIYPPVTKGISKMNNKNELRKKYGLPLDKKIIINVSNDFEYKNIDLLKPIIEKLGHDYYLIHVGSDLNFGLVFQNIDIATLNELYNLSDIALLPSSREGFGIPYIEAMATGLPVIASDTDIAREICGDAGIFSEINVNSFVNSIRNINYREYQKKSLERSKLFNDNQFKLNIIKLYSLI
jgi:glycosyltransferase involved in cell wall biosynthesis